MITSINSPQLWTLPFAVLGAVIGSFLNVVIHRIPRGLSVASPRWSFCPSCNQRIAARDNLPILGWILLGGRCRNCSTAISTIYPIVECITFLTFIALWDVVFISRLAPLPGAIPGDLPALIAFASLFAGLIAGAGMDFESYTIDIRIPLLTTAIAIICHATRGLPDLIPRSANALPPTLVGLSLVGGLAWIAYYGLFGARHEASAHMLNDAATADTPADQPAHLPATTPPIHETAARWPVLVLAVLAAAFTAWVMFWPAQPAGWTIPPGGVRGITATSLLLLVLILASMIHRPSDLQIITDIEQERPRARPTALRELAGFGPAILLCGGIFVYLRMTARMDTPWADLLPASSESARFWLVHLYGGLAALAAALAAAGMGWAVRILGTLAFGKEAFGTGDIYLLAAIAAAGGLWYTVIAFFMAALLALVGVVATSFHKSSRAIPFGPWLGLGAFAAIWLERPLTNFFSAAFSLFWSVICGRQPAIY